MKVGLVLCGDLCTRSGGFLYDRELVSHLRRMGDTVEVIPIERRSLVPSLLDNLSSSLLRRLSGTDVDVLVEDELAHSSLFRLNRRLKEAVSRPLIAVVHHLTWLEGERSWRRITHKTIEKAYLRSIDGFIFNSLATMAEVRRLLPDDRPSVIAPPAASHVASRATPGEVEERAGSNGPLRIVFVGNVIRRKLLHVLIAAMKHVSADWSLSVVGDLSADVDYARAAVRFAKRSLPSEKLIFHGTLSDKDLFAVMKQSHLLAMPSTYEGFGIAYLEGMAFGLPAIAGRVGGAREVVEDGYNGFLVPPGDAWALAKRVQKVADNRSLLAQMGLNALRTYSARPGWSESFSRVYDFLHSYSSISRTGDTPTGATLR